MQTFNNSLNAQFLEHRCEHCGFGWCELDEAIDTESCPNCSTPNVAPNLAHPLQHAAISEEARP